MIFDSSLDGVMSELVRARQSTHQTAGNLGSITNLTWNTSAGRSFEEKVLELIEVLHMLERSLDDTANYVMLAKRELDVLEAQIMGQRMAG
ncbi:hypothetical protein [Glutamicibacter sp. PS]|uniref:hypothetical protein n=1 Tax=Glutamicibacter sp. PS TaxID=3075634 RepID=UPI002842561E|nr:hypothetical protein [Glutamicibacter sp. PS]MDR4534268.1 hypothetical protein [Glutamicibacter sp. PS]